jgi:hypothetical protein
MKTTGWWQTMTMKGRTAGTTGNSKTSTHHCCEPLLTGWIAGINDKSQRYRGAGEMEGAQ